MSGQGTLTLSGVITGFATGTRTLSISMLIPTAVDAAIPVVLASGYNSINCPSGSTLAILTPPPGNTVALTLKGDTADVGIKLHKTYPTIIAIDSAPTIGITAASITTGVTQIEFF